MRLLLPALGALALVAARADAQRFGRGGFGGGGPQGDVWEFLAKKYDKNKDGKVTAEEYARGADKFRRYDRNQDGVLTKEDWAGRGRGGRRRGRRRMNPAMMLPVIVRGADHDGDGKVTAKEWKGFVRSKVADGVVDVEALLSGRMGPMASRIAPVITRSLDKDGNGDVDLPEITAVFATLDKDGNGVLAGDELGRSRRRGGRPSARVPQPGEVAPDFDLPVAKDPERTVRLASFAGKRPVALIFGSYT